jgi:hypothetical protein
VTGSAGRLAAERTATANDRDDGIDDDGTDGERVPGGRRRRTSDDGMAGGPREAPRPTTTARARD